MQLLTKLKFTFKIVFTLLVISACQSEKTSTDNATNLDKYNVVWTSPSKDHHGSMPLGNGDMGMNVWVEENGDICLYIGKTDAWGDNGRLLKVGKLRVKCDPAIVFSGSSFRQELDLWSGSILIASKGQHKGKEVDLNIRIWADANNPVLHLSYSSSVPLTMTAGIELWRTQQDSLSSIGVSDLLENRSMPGRLHKPVIVEPDNIISNRADYIGWFHHNKKSEGFDLTNRLQGISEYFKTDPILHRTFGAIIKGPNAEKINDKTLVTAKEKEGRLDVYVLTEHPSMPDMWQQNIEELSTSIEATPYKERKNAHEKWWSDFWDRSWMHARLADNVKSKVPNDAFIVSKAYTLQRFIDASAGRGNYPIKFNGSIFTVLAEGMPGGDDYRRWGPGYWWQNTRLPYLSMCSSGDYDLMQALFKMYAEDIYKLCKYRTNKYFGFEGVYFPECMYFWGSTFTATYGWTPFEERTDKLQESPWHKWEWVAGTELVFMMMDYFDYTQDVDFLNNKIIPIANDIMRFFDNYYQVDETGKLIMYPSMSAETWWDCTNPMPEIAGLHSITKRLLALPQDLVKTTDRDYWNRFSAKLPDFPTRETPSGKALAPAERYEDKNNVENPELYAVFPFRHFGVGKANLDWAKNALEHRWDKGNFGWRQDDLFMAYLGLAEQAREYLADRATKHDEKSRFPAFWGPNYDWTPDQDHGGILMKTFQSMLLQVDPYSQTIYLLPAWPKDWNVDFKLHAPYNTVLEGKVEDGEIKKLKITPSSRKKDIIIIGNSAMVLP
ncbi:MAG: DUF5703 domain-containing protein [Bacteroidota bacterium]